MNLFCRLELAVTSLRSSPKARGAALVELAMVLPLVIMIIFGGIEFSRQYKTQQALIAMSKEVTSDIFRTCWDLAAITNQSGHQACLNTELNSFSYSGAYLSFAIPNVRIRMGLLDCQTASPTRLDATLNSPPATRYPATNLPQNLRNLCVSHKRIVIGELSHDYRSLVPNLIPFGNSLGGAMYALSIF